MNDNKQARWMIKHYLRDCVDEFRACDDGAEVLSAYTEFKPDWVLMDWEMKQVHGLAATERIIADFPAAQILIATNYDEKNIRQAATEAGTICFVTKDNLLALQIRKEIKGEKNDTFISQTKSKKLRRMENGF